MYSLYIIYNIDIVLLVRVVVVVVVVVVVAVVVVVLGFTEAQAGMVGRNVQQRISGQRACRDS
jgi:hypothetical protein